MPGKKLRLKKIAAPVGAEIVERAEKGEGHMVTAQEAAEACCRKCWKHIGEGRAFFRVNDYLFHAECTKAL